MRFQARDFDPDSLRSGLPKAVSSLEWAIAEGKGKVYVHCTAGLGRAPAVAIAYMFWFCDMDVSIQIFNMLPPPWFMFSNRFVNMFFLFHFSGNEG